MSARVSIHARASAFPLKFPQTMLHDIPVLRATPAHKKPHVRRIGLNCSMQNPMNCRGNPTKRIVRTRLKSFVPLESVLETVISVQVRLYSTHRTARHWFFTRRCGSGVEKVDREIHEHVEERRYDGNASMYHDNGRELERQVASRREVRHVLRSLKLAL